MHKKILCKAVIFTIIITLSALPANAVEVKDNYDIIIAGAGTGGISAAIQAASMGVEVLVIEPSSMLGGQAIAAGVSNMDDFSSQSSGIYAELISRVEEYYSARGKSIHTTYWDTWHRAFEPHIGRKILNEMARGEDAPDIIYRSEIIAVGKEKVISVTGENISEAPRINSVIVRTPEGVKNITCKILIDATEYGDILPLSGADYRAGNSITPNINPDAMIQDITWTAVIRKYPDGIPEHLRPKTPLPSYDMERYNFVNYVTKDGSSFMGVFPVKIPVNVISHNAYRGLPDSFSEYNYDASPHNWHLITKTSINWANDFPGQSKWGKKYGLPVSYLEDRNLRKRAERDALIKTLNFIWYMQNELGESWSVDENEYDELQEAAKDFPAEWQVIARHLPPVPYVRESRRGVGIHTLISEELFKNSESYRTGNGNNEFQDAIATGCYMLDLHHTDVDADMEADLGEKAAYIQEHKPIHDFQVPMSILIPKSVDGLLFAEKNLSMSRLVSGALRLQPITMMTGQAAGALAAVAVIRNIQPRFVKPLHVQAALLKSGVNLTLCPYSDVPPGHKYYAGVQISNLYRLLEPKKYPVVQSRDIQVEKPEEFTGIFGVDEILSTEERNSLMKRAEEISGTPITLPEGNITRGEAVDFVVKEIEKL